MNKLSICGLTVVTGKNYEFVFNEATMKGDQRDKGHVMDNQAVIECWKERKIPHMRFYGIFESGPIGE